MKRKVKFKVRTNSYVIDALNRTMKVYAEVVNKAVNEGIYEVNRLPERLRDGCYVDIEKAKGKGLAGELAYCSQMNIRFATPYSLTNCLYIPVIKKDGTFGIVKGSVYSEKMKEVFKDKGYTGFKKGQVEILSVRLYGSFTNLFDAVTRNSKDKE